MLGEWVVNKTNRGSTWKLMSGTENEQMVWSLWDENKFIKHVFARSVITEDLLSASLRRESGTERKTAMSSFNPERLESTFSTSPNLNVLIWAKFSPRWLSVSGYKINVSYRHRSLSRLHHPGHHHHLHPLILIILKSLNLQSSSFWPQFLAFCYYLSPHPCSQSFWTVGA